MKALPILILFICLRQAVWSDTPTAGQPAQQIKQAAPSSETTDNRNLALGDYMYRSTHSLPVASPFFPQQIVPVFDENPQTVTQDIKSHLKPIDTNDIEPSAILAQDLKNTIDPLLEDQTRLTDILKELQDHMQMITCDKPESITESAAGRLPTNYNLCDSNLLKEILAPISKTDSSVSKVFTHLRDNIYRPLGLKLEPNRYSFSDTINDLLSIDETVQTIHNNMAVPTPSLFKEQILGNFKEVEAASSNFEANKDLISNQIIDILKNFHIFWNYNRQKKLFNVTKSSTMNIVKQLIQQYNESNASMQVTLLNILENIKEAFFRFMKAHKMRDHFKEHPSETVAFHMVNRYKDAVQMIRDRKIVTPNFVEEIAAFLDLLRGFHIINYKLGKTEDVSMQEYDDKIGGAISQMFEVYWKYMNDVGDPQTTILSDFTAILLLKMRHRNHIIFNKYRIENYVLMPSNSLKSSFTKTVKLYYQMMDNMVLLPSDCDQLNANQLEDCVTEKADIYLAKVDEELMLHTSISGVNIYQFLKRGFSTIFENIRQKNLFREFMTFRNEFMAQLYGFSEKFKQDYQIRDMRAVAELESEIGFQIEKAKTIDLIPSADFTFIDQLDKLLYDFFLDIKNDYNKYAPVTRDLRVMKEIVDKLQQLIIGFYRVVKDPKQEGFKRLLLTIVREGQLWIKKHSVKFVVNSHEKNYDPQLLKVIPLNGLTPDDMQEFLNQPVLTSNMMSPTSAQQFGQLANNPFMAAFNFDENRQQADGKATKRRI